MPRERKTELQKVTINLEAGDKDTLTTFYPAKGWSVAARELIHNHCEVLRERDSQEVQAGGLPLDIDVPAIKETLQ